MEYLAYCRKSSEAEEKQALSIESQINEILELSKKYSIKIDHIFQESMSAKEPGRPIFNEMIKRIEKNPNETILLTWKFDRLARNGVDGGRISYLMDKGHIREIMTPERTFRNNSDDKFMMHLDFGIAKKYVDDLSQNVKRGNKTKLGKGGWPGPAPFGYLNNLINKTIILDPKRSYFVKRIFELYATGAYSLKEISLKIYKEGLRSIKGNQVAKTTIHRILKNPFYFGVMRSNGNYYSGNHKPIISKKLFNDVEKVFNKSNRPKKEKHDFTYRGFIKCENCGCSITATKKKKHDYYYCTNGKSICEEHKKYMRSEKIDNILANLFGKIRFDKELIEMGYKASIEKLKNTQTSTKTNLNCQKEELKKNRNKQNKLLNGYLTNTVSEFIYKQKAEELSIEEKNIELSIKKQQKKADPYSTLELIKNKMMFAHRAKKKFLKGNNSKKRKMLEILLWNLGLKEQKMASFLLKEPYQTLANAPKNPTSNQWLGRKDSNLRSRRQRPLPYHLATPQ